MNPVGIMQGRLSPAPPGRPQSFPLRTWEGEFDLARELGFDTIEWLVCADSLDANPLLSDEGPDRIRQIATGSGVGVSSICADCFIAWPFVRVPADVRRERAELLARLAERTQRVGAGTLVVPVLEQGELRTSQDADDLLDALHHAHALARDTGVTLAIESDLPAERLVSLLQQAPFLAVCYDIGNATARRGDIPGDLQQLGARVRAVHVKDRLVDGPNVPLGRGDASLEAAFDALSAIGFAGPLVLETPVGLDAAASARANLAYVRARRPRVSSPA